jgi:hypothetical protein
MINLLAMYHRNKDAGHFPFTPKISGRKIDRSNEGELGGRK